MENTAAATGSSTNGTTTASSNAVKAPNGNGGGAQAQGISKDDGRSEGDDIEGGTNVLEVWFSGCHSGQLVFLLFH